MRDQPQHRDHSWYRIIKSLGEGNSRAKPIYLEKEAGAVPMGDSTKAGWSERDLVFHYLQLQSQLCFNLDILGHGGNPAGRCGHGASALGG